MIHYYAITAFIQINHPFPAAAIPMRILSSAGTSASLLHLHSDSRFWCTCVFGAAGACVTSWARTCRGTLGPPRCVSIYYGCRIRRQLNIHDVCLCRLRMTWRWSGRPWRWRTRDPRQRVCAGLHVTIDSSWLILPPFTCSAHPRAAVRPRPVPGRSAQARLLCRPLRRFRGARLLLPAAIMPLYG